nr:DUF1259 domain-containing protein [Sporosarcina sp. ANT_H38]
MGVLFESLDEKGVALNLAEITILASELTVFMHSITQQGKIISVLHNYWLYMQPTIMYIHIQSVEPPLVFSRKLAYSITLLSRYPFAN